MNSRFKDLIEFDFWALSRSISSAESFREDPRLLDLISHTLTARVVWLDRIHPGSAPEIQWTPRSLEENKTLLTMNQKNWLAWLSGISDPGFSEKVAYKNIKGEPFTSKLEDILTHVVNHSTYHRGQVAARVKELGGQPLPTDYIVYCREFHV